jgi:predicted nucleic acid-binding protein
MKDKVFVDTNVVVYVFDKTVSKQAKSIEIIKNKPVISSQVIIESLNVCIKKLKLSKEAAYKNSIFLLKYCEYQSLESTTFIRAFSISEKYGYSHLDSLIIASALETNCTQLYSEDMQHNQLIEKKLRIVNPFL